MQNKTGTTNIKTWLAGASLCALALPSAHARLIPLESVATGAQVVPAVETTGRAIGHYQFDDETNLFSWDISLSGLAAPETGAHIHGPAPVGQNSPDVQVHMEAGPHKTGSETLSDAQEKDLLAGLWYLSVHSTLFPKGEIRGQITAVPEPASLLMLGAGLGLIGLAGRRRASSGPASSSRHPRAAS